MSLLNLTIIQYRYLLIKKKSYLLRRKSLIIINQMKYESIFDFQLNDIKR